MSAEEVEFDGQKVTNLKTGESITRKEIGNKVMSFNNEALSASEAFSSPTSPPPFMVGMAEVEIDKETGVPELIDYVAGGRLRNRGEPEPGAGSGRGRYRPRASVWRSMKICLQ